ncbi:hypothetical protein SLA2020_024090 [Shorea laevis]
MDFWPERVDDDLGLAPSYKSVALGGVGTIQSILLSPVEIVKIRLQSQNKGPIPHHPTTTSQRGPISVAKGIWRTEGLRGVYRGFTITFLRDVPAYGFYFWTYECTRGKLHPGCRKRGVESLKTMLVAGGMGMACSWRGLGAAVARAFVVNGAVFTAYETTLRCLFNNGSIQKENTI